MKVIIEFDLDNENEVGLHKTYIKAEDMALALWDIKQELRQITKYSDLSEEQFEVMDKFHDKFFDILSEYDLKHIVDL